MFVTVRTLKPGRALITILLRYFIEIFCHLSVGLTKLSFVLLYARVFQKRSFHIALWILGGLILAWLLPTWIILINQCNPVAGAWDLAIARAKCINLKNFLYGQAIADAVFDFIILCLPIVIVWRLQMDIARKIAVTAVFGLGVL